ncbi:hypothetical protein F5Y16DRAFT_422491 [Xylariaceae sp. FL0255]|nr:hypothetical protein F5Y16DRAFT_422491 [Xylariaceae sp. FL0255]
MRLLTRKDSRSFSLTDYPAGTVIPPYAILSHTWGPDEVTYEDLKHGIGLRKSGYHKIRFCGEQAERDGLRHFWVDTCCIDKSGSAELTESINSMFRWYGSAAKCYVYLDDIGYPATRDSDQSQHQQTRQQLRESRWFTRGWTLQELIAPKTVEFFSKEGAFLGDKQSLEQPLCDITGIPARALRGGPLPGFTVAERMAWAERRETTRPEDRAYSLLGIFNVQMPLIYGEGEQNASRRLREEITKSQKGIQHEDFTVPFSLHGVPEIEYFVAREQELAEMRKALTSDGTRRVVVLHGLGGMGKTQLAIAYTKQHKDNYSAIFWLNIKDEDSLKQSFARMAHHIKRYHPSAGRIGSMDIQNDLDETIDAVKAWLSLPNNSRWLLVYDNYDNPKLPSNTDPTAIDIRKYFPESYQGSIVITTRSSEVKIGYGIRMSKIQNLNDSLEILRTTSKRQGLTQDPDARQLATKLDGLPLALATAGAYLEQTSITFHSYLRYYEDSWATLQKDSPELMSYEDRTLYSTWQLSFDQIQRLNEHSAMLLRLWAYFDNQDVWLELLQYRDTNSPEWIYEVTKDELSFHNTVRVLRDYGLVEINSSADELIESKGYSIHSCVHSWTSHVLNEELDLELASFALECIASHVPSRNSDKWWLTERRLLQHAIRYNDTVLDVVVDKDQSWIYGNLGRLYRNQEKLKEAEKMYQRALRGFEKTLGPTHTLALDTVHNLGLLYSDQENLKQAEEMYQWALRGYEKALRPNHMSTLGIIGSLGNLYSKQGKMKEAEEMYQRVLQGFEKALGPNHTSTLGTVGNLGILYSDQGKMKEAEKMYQRALQGFEKVLGPNHTSTLSVVGNLGHLYHDQGRLKQAEEMCQRALRGFEKTLGPNHTSTLDIVANLCGLYRHQGKLSEAEEMCQQALQSYENTLGPNHTSTLGMVGNLGNLYSDQGKLRDAKETYQRALQGYEKALGPDHTLTLKTVGKLRDAKETYQRALRGYEKVLGPDHTSTLDTGKLVEAEEMYQRALRGYQTSFGADHPRTQLILKNLQRTPSLKEIKT